MHFDEIHSMLGETVKWGKGSASSTSDFLSIVKTPKAKEGEKEVPKKFALSVPARLIDNLILASCCLFEMRANS